VDSIQRPAGRWPRGLSAKRLPGIPMPFPPTWSLRGRHGALAWVNVDERGMTLLGAAFEAGARESLRNDPNDPKTQATIK